MNVIKLGGVDKKLYELVAPLVMNPAIIRQNNNYPFKTSRNHTWYIAVENELVTGFIPVKTGTTTLLIDNYYISGDSTTVIECLLNKIIADFNEPGILSALVHKRHIDVFKKHGFQTTKIWSKYDKMQYNPTDRI